MVSNFCYRRFFSFRYLFALVAILTLVDGPLAVFAADASAAKLTENVVVLTESQRVQQVISRLTFGARPGDLDRVSKIGADAFIKQQLDMSTAEDEALEKRLKRLPTLVLDTPNLAEQFNPPKPKPSPSPAATLASTQPATDMKTAETKIEPTMTANQNPTVSVETVKPSPTPAAKPTPVPKNPGMVVNELQRAKLLRAVYSDRQLYEVMVDFWENHFSIYANKDADRWMLTGFDRDAIRPFAFGRFRDLLGAVAHSPAMMFYLDNWQSSVLKEYPATKDKPARTSGGINENYARELMELHTLGVDGGYTQKDVQEVARCFTGWTIRKPNEEGIFVYNPAAHDNGEKTVLGQKIAAGGGIGDGERVLDILAKSPATAHFIATKIARRFIGDDPPALVVDRAAKVFLSTDGSITDTLRSIITSKEFFSPAAFHAKVKTPFEYVASALRATDAETDGGQVLDWVRRMGQPVFGRVTPDGYPDMASEWLSNNDLLARLNFSSALMFGKIKGTTVKTEKIVNLSDDPPKMPAEIIRSLLMNNASDKTRAALDKLASTTPTEAQIVNTSAPAAAAKWAPDAKPADRNKMIAEELVALALGSPEFQRR